ncbi:hypothetical protein B0T14DRAFT_533851 [Immersiella caudata]|uniref:Elongator complex protein 6 n=1 Tax=Immersiella caudata TaxID=314043 RepID=A0AA39XGR0_9PEZI|nr:hypothetical protein B0T14DRAFT_533851 [Immersiella caudata]
MSRTLPHHLEPYLALPDEAALVVLTGILGASTNWLVLRYLYSFLKAPATLPARQQPTGLGEKDKEVSVLLVSFLRDFNFWKEGAGRLGVDLEGLSRRGRFGFVDGLGRLFLGGVNGEGAAPAPAPVQRGVGGGLLAQRGLPVRAAPGGGSAGGGRWTITNPAVIEVGRVLRMAVDELAAKGREVVLVVDQLDFLLAAAGGEGGIVGVELREVLLELRENTHAAVITLSADEPLINAQTTGLEKEHVSFVMSLAHEAQTVVSLRLLDTGTAKDVSGVMRITSGGDDSGALVEERELLYHVGGDAGVRVFERGQ